MLWGYVAGGWQMARAALIAAKKSGDPFYDAKLVTARYYATTCSPKALRPQTRDHERRKESTSRSAKRSSTWTELSLVAGCRGFS